MKLAFYAPLKPPDHPVPSGERTMARSLMAAFEHAGATLTLASTLRSRDGKGDAAVQADLIAQAEAGIPQIIAAGRAANWQAWVTYHSYYKAPDLIGPAAARALGIPYLLIEATRARKRLTGPWARFAQIAEAACDAADVICYLTTRDGEALHRDAPQGQVLTRLSPFLNRLDLPPQATGDGPMLSVGMMRHGDKLASYGIIAEALAALPRSDWQLQIAGDGPARAKVDTLMAPFGDRVRFLGALDAPALAAAYQNASLLLWPGVNEAFGMTYLEAQACGLPVVAQDRPGVCDVLAPAPYPAVDAGPAALAARITTLLGNTTARHAAGDAARAHIAAHHLLGAASATLRETLARIGVPS